MIFFTLTDIFIKHLREREIDRQKKAQYTIERTNVVLSTKRGHGVICHREEVGTFQCSNVQKLFT